MMHRISIPIIHDNVNPDTKEAYLRLLQDARADRVFLVVTDFCKTQEEENEQLRSLSENIRFFSSHGIESAIWVGTTIGHGSSLMILNQNTAIKQNITPLRNLAGEDLAETRCPLDPTFRSLLADRVAKLATTGASCILLDDDFRLSQHGKDFCCACDLHMERIQAACGAPITREELRAAVFQSKANRYRDAWLSAQGDSLRGLAQRIREAVDAVAPEVPVALCAAHSVWDIDGTTPIELSSILAGQHRPLTRILGAPYWSAKTTPLPTVFAIARMCAYFCKSVDMEVMAEGDVYPRPRHHVPASYLELYNGVVRADGHFDGILKYMLDYTASPRYELGYVEHHCENLPVMQQLSDLFAHKQTCGVSVCVRHGLLKHADLSMGTASDCYPYPTAGAMLGACGIPTTFGHDGICHAIFGEEARHTELEELQKGAILDGIAARLLTERGIDVGLAQSGDFREQQISYLRSSDRKDTIGVKNSACKLLSASLSPAAQPVAYVLAQDGEELLAYTYENQDKQRFLVFLFDAMSLPKNNALFRTYLTQQLLTQGAEWIAGQRLPASCTGNPDLYIMCARCEGALAVGLFNCFADRILHPTVKLDRPYQSIRFLNCSGYLDGDTVRLNHPLHAFEFAAFEVW